MPTHDRPNLGLATTFELLQEVQARYEMGHTDPGHRTVAPRLDPKPNSEPVNLGMSESEEKFALTQIQILLLERVDELEQQAALAYFRTRRADGRRRYEELRNIVRKVCGGPPAEKEYEEEEEDDDD